MMEIYLIQMAALLLARLRLAIPAHMLVQALILVRKFAEMELCLAFTSAMMEISMKMTAVTPTVKWKYAGSVLKRVHQSVGFLLKTLSA